MANRPTAADWEALYLRLRRRWADDPIAYAKERLGLNPTRQQGQLLEAIREPGAKVAIRSGHGTGKTGSVGAAAWWFLETKDQPKVPCTAPTAHQLRDVLWAELGKWRRKADELWDARRFPPQFRLKKLFVATNERVYAKDNPAEWYIVARTSGRDNPDALQGFHASNMTISEDGTEIIEADEGGQILFIVEEASGVHEEVFEVAEGALSSPDSRLIMPGNPTKNHGYFAEAFKARRSRFTTLHFRSDESPLVDPEFRANLVKKWGEGSNVVRVRADGEFPRQDDDVLIPLELAEAPLQRDVLEVSPATKRKMGIDVARYGSDRTVFTKRTGANLDRIAIRGGLDTMEVVGVATQLAQEWGIDQLYVDEVGVGAGVLDRLTEMGWAVMGVNVSEAAPAMTEGMDAQGKTLRDWLWLAGKAFLRHEEPSFARAQADDHEAAQDLAAELTSTRFKVESDGIRMERKEDAKKRGIPSPDLADSFLLTLYPHDPSAAPVASAGTRKFGRR